MRPGRKRSLPGLFLLLRERKARNIMEIKVKAPYEPLVVEVGDRTVNARINVTVDGLLDIGEACNKAANKMGALQKLHDEAQKTNDVKKLRKLNGQMADVLETAVKAGIGEESYDEIVAACGQGFEITKADCNVVMVKVFWAIFETVKERKDESLNEKAAHYLAEVDHAQTEPNTAD